MRRTSSLEERLRSEAAFQNRRVEAGAEGGVEPRDKYYYLLERAKQHYDGTLTGVTGQRVLVVGCSEGGVTPLARRGATVTGIDIAEVAIERLNEAIRREGLAELADARVMNAEALEFPPGSFDVICCSGVLHHLDVEIAISSWARTLKDTGRITMIEPMALNPLIALYRLATPSMRTADEHPLMPRDIAILRSHFREVKVEGYVLTSLLSVIWVFLPNVLSLKERSMRWLDRIDRILLRLIPPLKYCCWSAVITASGPRVGAAAPGEREPAAGAAQPPG